MRVAVVGGSGFIGRPLVRRLVAAGHEVAALHRGKTGLKLPPGATAIHCDRSHVDATRRALARFAPDAVVDLIAYSEVDARALIEATASLDARLVVVSSADVYRAYDRLHRKESGALEPVPLGEEAPLRERLYPYRREPPREADAPDRWLDDYEKILVERAVRAADDASTVVRLPMVYGPGDRQHRFLDVVQRIRDRRPGIPLEEGWARWRTSFGYVENVAEAIAVAVLSDFSRGRIYNAAEADAPTSLEWARDLARVAGFRGSIASFPHAAAPAHLRGMSDALDLAQHLVVSSERIRAELGYAEPVSRDACLRETLAWELAHTSDEVARARFDYAAEDALFRTDAGVP